MKFISYANTGNTRTHLSAIVCNSTIRDNRWRLHWVHILEKKIFRLPRILYWTASLEWSFKNPYQNGETEQWIWELLLTPKYVHMAMENYLKFMTKISLPIRSKLFFFISQIYASVVISTSISDWFRRLLSQFERFCLSWTLINCWIKRSYKWYFTCILSSILEQYICDMVDWKHILLDTLVYHISFCLIIMVIGYYLNRVIQKSPTPYLRRLWTWVSSHLCNRPVSRDIAVTVNFEIFSKITQKNIENIKHLRLDYDIEITFAKISISNIISKLPIEGYTWKSREKSVFFFNISIEL